MNSTVQENLLWSMSLRKMKAIDGTNPLVTNGYRVPKSARAPVRTILLLSDESRPGGGLGDTEIAVPFSRTRTRDGWYCGNASSYVRIWTSGGTAQHRKFQINPLNISKIEDRQGRFPPTGTRTMTF